jgi:Methyltransferase domain
MNCRLCGSENCAEILQDNRRRYYRCPSCGLVFVPADDHVPLEKEIKRYDLHDNGPGHKGYLDYLQTLVSMVEELCVKSARILDYGCGRNAVLTGLLTGKGYDCTPYDPLYAIGPGALDRCYDVIILCEVIEHLRDLQKEMALLKKAAGEKGTIVIRTQMSPPQDEFPSWWYKNDCTHVNFFCPAAILVLAALLGRKSVEQKANDIFVLR